MFGAKCTQCKRELGDDAHALGDAENMMLICIDCFDTQQRQMRIIIEHGIEERKIRQRQAEEQAQPLLDWIEG